MGQSILVVGGCGYVGSSLVPELAKRDHDVRVWDLLWFGNHLPSEIPVEHKDFFDAEIGDLTGIDTVIFLAGLSNDPMAGFSPKKNYIANAAGPGFLAYLAKQAGVRRFIHGGTCSIYGSMPHQLADETTRPQSTFPYGISKLQGEVGCAALADESFKVLLLRKGTVCGHSPRMRFDLIINTMFRDAILKRCITVDDGLIWRPILGIKDAVQAYIRGVEFEWGELPHSFALNIASTNKQVLHVAQLVKQFVERRLGIYIEIVHAGRKSNRDYKVACDRASATLGYSAQQGIERIIEGLFENLDSYDDFSDISYYNIETFVAQGQPSVPEHSADAANFGT